MNTCGRHLITCNLFKISLLNIAHIAYEKSEKSSEKLKKNCSKNMKSELFNFICHAQVKVDKHSHETSAYIES